MSSNPTNNRADADTSIVGLADLVLDKSGPQTAVAGDLVTYTIRARNDGPSLAKFVDIKDQLPPGVTLENATRRSAPARARRPAAAPSARWATWPWASRSP